VATEKGRQKIEGQLL